MSSLHVIAAIVQIGIAFSVPHYGVRFQDQEQLTAFRKEFTKAGRLYRSPPQSHGNHIR